MPDDKPLEQVMKGFEDVCTMPLADAREAASTRTRSRASTATTRRRCNCASRRPAFLNGIAALAKSDDPVPHLPSIERWRQGRPEAAVRPERRGHPAGDAVARLRPVPRRVLLQEGHQARHLPLAQGAEGRADRGVLRRDRLHRLDARDGRHADAQGPAPGVRDVEPGHPRPQRRGAAPTATCRTCARGRSRSATTTSAARCSTSTAPARPATATRRRRLQARVDGDPGPDPRAARPGRGRVRGPDPGRSRRRRSGGATDDQLADARKLHRAAQWRADFVQSENSRGFHAPQEAARILGEAIDFARQGQLKLAKAQNAVNGLTPGQYLGSASRSKVGFPDYLSLLISPLCKKCRPPSNLAQASKSTIRPTSPGRSRFASQPQCGVEVPSAIRPAPQKILTHSVRVLTTSILLATTAHRTLKSPVKLGRIASPAPGAHRG